MKIIHNVFLTENLFQHHYSQINGYYIYCVGKDVWKTKESKKGKHCSYMNSILCLEKIKRI